MLVSACLAGIACRYDGRSIPHDMVMDAVRRGIAVPACAEQLGDMPTPRPPAEIVNGDGHDVLDAVARVMTADGDDVTDDFIRGAHAVLRKATRLGVGRAWLQGFSPSCGSGRIYDGTHTGGLTTGSGVTAALLTRNGIAVETIRGSKP